ncbi:MAG: ACP S-malonyltransferase [Patescibacteria group bacterium]
MQRGKETDYRSVEPPKENMMLGGKVASVFPGQGSQFVGMGFELYQNSRSARDVFDEVDQALRFKLSRLIFEGSDKDLTDTINSQPAITAVSIASVKALEETLGNKIPQSEVVAGHSLGFYTSLVVAGVIPLSDGVRLVRERGRLMKEESAKRPGGMVAIIGLDQLTLEEICQEVGAEISNINSLNQLIISGDRIALARATDLASARGARKAVSLAVSGAFHSSLMGGARDELARIINAMEFNDPKIPIVGNSNAKFLTTAQEVKEELIDGLCNCVQWHKSVLNMVNFGVSHFIEFGPGRVLSGLIRQIDESVQAFSINSPGSIQKLANAMAP